MRIAIIGCGTAGAASALLLSRDGHDVTVFERVAEPRPVGAGIMMQPSGLMVLSALGCVEPVLARGARVDRLLAETPSGARVLDLAYAALGSDLYGVGLHRGVLFDTLLSAVRASSATLACGVGISRVVFGPGSTRVLVTDAAERIGPFELVVVCDGARSHVRDAMHDVAKRVERYPWGALWFVGSDREGQYEGVLHQKVRGTRAMVGMLPTGLGPDGHDVRHTSLFFSVRGDEVERWRAGGVDTWKQHVRTIAPEAEALLAQIDAFDQLTFATYFDVTMPRWHAPGVVFLGDAAHATSPQLGQGCNLALCDAEALAVALRSSARVGEALERYSADRRAHLDFYQLATRWLTPFFQSDLTPLAWVRDALMRRAGWLRYAEREMVRSMCGTKTGIFSGSMRTEMPAKAPVEAPTSLT